MKRKVIQTKQFQKIVDGLLKKRQLLQEDFDEFQKNIIEFPEMGDLIPGTGGVRKARLKSASGGKSGGFRVCYYFLMQKDRLYFILIYGKNVQEDLTSQEKKELKQLSDILKGQSQ